MSSTDEGSRRGAGTGPMIALACGIGSVLVVGAVILIPPALRGDANTKSAPGASSAGTQSTNPSGENLGAVLQRAMDHQRAGRFADAARELQPLVEREESPASQDQGVRVALAQAYLGLKQYTDAYAQYEAAIAIAGPEARPGSDGAGGVRRNPSAAALHFEAGTCATQASLVERAIEHYTTAQTLDPAEARYPLFLGMVQARVGDDAAAVASLIRAAKLKPDSAEAWGTLAELELRRNNARLALQHVERARTIQPNVARWRVVEARALNRTNEPEKALAILTALDAASRADKGVLALTAECYGLLKRPADAAAMYAQAAGAQPSDSEIAYQAALWAQRAGDADASKRFAQQAAGLGHAGAKALVSGSP